MFAAVSIENVDITNTAKSCSAVALLMLADVIG